MEEHEFSHQAQQQQQQSPRDFFRKINFKRFSIPKLIGFALIAIILFMVAISFLGFAFRTAFFGFGSSGYSTSQIPMMSYEYEGALDQTSLKGISDRAFLSPIPPGSGGSVGTDAEEFEITEYYTVIKTRNLDKACSVIEELKPLEYVIFETANRSDKNCSYFFKVKNENADEVLATVKGLKPEIFRENTSTIKSVIGDYTSEVEIQEKKLASIEETLTNAQQAYDKITVLATQTKDVESLTKIIDSKIRLIERLTQERINIKERIDRLNKNKAEQLDRLNFTFFRVNIHEFLVFDLKELKDSWISEFKSFVREFNDILQDVSINLAGFLLRLIQAALYFLIALFILKYGWRFTKRIWKA